MKKQAVLLVSFLMGVSVLLSSCSMMAGIIMGKQAAKDIRKVVSAYFDELIDGSLTKLNYKTEYADDSLFAKLKLGEDEARSIMIDSFSDISYEIMDSTGDTAEKTGSCTVTLNYIDIESVLNHLYEGYDPAALRKVVFAEDAPTDNRMITLPMSFDSDTLKWMIADTSRIIKCIGKPYQKIMFRLDPSKTIDSLMNALSDGDDKTLTKLCPAFTWNNFYPYCLTMEEMQSYYKAFDYEINTDSVIEGDTAVIHMDVSRPDISRIWNYLSEDAEYMAEIIKPYVYNLAINDGDPFFYLEDMVADMWPEGEGYFTDVYYSEDIQMSFGLKYETDSGMWVFENIPEDLYQADLDFDTIKKASDSASVAAMDLLLEEGTFDQATYDRVLPYYDQPADIPFVTGDELTADILGAPAWMGYSDGEYIEGYTYNADNTYYIRFEVDFRSDWSGVELRVDWYGEDGTIPLSSNMVKIIGGSDGGYAICDYPYEYRSQSLLPAGIYKVVVSAPDGTEICTGSIELK